MATIAQRDYIDRGVQTDLARPLSRPDSSNPGNPRPFPSPNTFSTIRSRCSSYSPGFIDLAHGLSPVSGNHPMDPHAAGPTRSPPTSRKHAQLPYSRPSHMNTTIQRILSLPETCPPYSTQMPRETRGVSLSDRPRGSFSFSDNTAESSASPETSFVSENRSGSGSSRARRSLPSSDMPRTPSPPSSPDSVMIIGNDMQVPVSFLRQKIKVKSSQAYEDDGGWISWANSPPKPIPALHGPLSLPYARCPSGAEGTIVEGEDLSHMIWGLGIEENGTQPTHSRNNSAHASQKSTPQPNLSSRFPTQRNFQPTTVSHPRHNASPRHQFQDNLNSPSVGGYPTKINEARTQLHIHQRALESLGPRHSLVSEQASPYPDSWTEVCGMHDLVDRLGAYEGQRGLGLDWQETLRHQRQMAKPPNSLKPSAPVFVPANQQATPPFPRIFVEPRVSHVIHPSQRLTAMEIAQQYRDQHRAQNSLPTPPGSSSPQWTTFRPQYTDPLPPLDIHNLPFVQQPQNFVQQYHHRDTHQPAPDPSEELRRFVYDQMRSPELNLTRDYTHNKPNDPSFMHQTPPLTPHVSSSPRYRNATSDASPSYPGPPPNSPLPPIPSTRTTQLRTMYAPPPSPTSPDPRIQTRNFNRPPRSVPFARMLQRRLSSVPEEENTPPPSPPKVSATARPPRPPSQSLADSFQSRSHSGASGLASPGRNGLTPQTRSSAELESDEAGWRMPRAGGVKATVKLPLKTANSEAADSQGEESTKTEGSVSENAWEKENGKPRRKVRGKKAKVGNSTRVVEDNVSPWLAASKGIEAWL